MIDTGLAVIAHRSHRRLPRHPEAGRHPRHRRVSRSDPPGDLGPGPLGEHRPRSDLLRGLRPGLRRTVRVWAAPDPLGPHQRHRLPDDREIPDLHPTAAMPDRPAATSLAARDRRGGLDRQPPLLAVMNLGAHDEPVQSYQRRHAPAIVDPHQGPPPVDVPSTATSIVRPLTASKDPQQDQPGPISNPASSRRALKPERWLVAFSRAATPEPPRRWSKAPRRAASGEGRQVASPATPVLRPGRDLSVPSR